ncbi:MAG TPA: amidohydrolase family protein [Candidatus Solibacter sp.]|nr:amidohydrolase family protein [Candidatus Solibacter sp.]
MSYDLVIKNANIIDGSGAAARHGSVGVEGGKVAAIDKTLSGGKREIDAHGLTLAPGFIDIHTHFDAQVSWDPLLTPTCWHGVTSVLMGNCGVGVAPCRPEKRSVMAWDLVNVEAMPHDVLLNGVNWEWETYPEYIAAIKRRGTALNIAMMVPLSALRFYVMGEAAVERTANTEELDMMCGMLREAIAAGAYGFSLSLARQHIGYQGRPLASRLASREELGALARTVRSALRGTIQLNLPRDQQGLITEESYATLDFVARELQRPVTWTPFVMGSKDLPERLHARIQPTLRDGFRIATQTSCRPVQLFTTLREPFMFASLPSWKAAFNRTTEEQIALYRNAEFRREFSEDLAAGRGTVFRGRWETVAIARTKKDENRRFLDKPVPEVAAIIGKDPIDAILDLAIDEDLATGFRLAAGNFNHELVAKAIQSPNIMIGLSDAGAHVDQLCNAGMPSYLIQEWVTKRRLLTIEQAVQRLTSEPASFFGFSNKGQIAPGFDADLTMFDPDAVKLNPQESTNDLPGGKARIVERSEGFAYTIVGGQVVLDHGEYQGVTPGRVI